MNKSIDSKDLPKELIKEECGGCKFYKSSGETTYGLYDDSELHPNDYESRCRRYPPVFDALTNKATLDSSIVHSNLYNYPVVNTLGWCGEWFASR